MQKLNTSRALLALSAASIALLPLSGSLEAKPKDKHRGGPSSQAPAWGYRTDRNNDRNSRRGDRDYGDDDYGSEGDYRNDRNGAKRRGQGVGRNDYGSLVTLEGIVTNRRDANSFEVRAGGRTFYVRSTTSVTVNAGDRVVVRGAFDNNDFNAQSVRVLRGGDRRADDDQYGNDYRPGSDRRVDFPGTVTRILSSREVEVRGDNGQLYRVETRSDANSVVIGTRVRVSGEGNGTRIRNASVFANGNTGGSYSDGSIFNFGKNVDFPGTIVRLDTARNEGTVRGDNGRNYTVRGSEVDGFRVGERVRVRGVSRAGFIDLRDLDRI